MLHNVYFSAKGTTELCAKLVGENLHMPEQHYNWCSPQSQPGLRLTAEDVLLFAMPVYGGFIPQTCAQMAENLQGVDTPAIILAVYGNRHYDNALLQMKDILHKQGFRVIAAGAFLAEHSIFPAVAAGRPDERDKQAMADFAAKCRQLLAQGNFAQYAEIQVPGQPDYNPAAYKGVPLRPDGAKNCVDCVDCGKCAKICPQKAISPANPRKTDAKLCISCGACIQACPVGARNYHGLVYKTAESQVKKKCAEYRLPETYYIAD